MAFILVVEDEMSIADTLVFALAREGFETRWVRLGREAVDCVEAGSVLFVILDVGLPDLSCSSTCSMKASRSPIMPCLG